MEKLLGKEAIEAAIKSGNINISTNRNVEVMELNAESKAAQLKHSEVLQKYETQKRARSIAVPTSIEEIKSKLRQLRQPVTLFGEDHADRRERLREVIANMELGEEELSKMKSFLNQAASQTSTLEVKSSTATNVHSTEKLTKAAIKEIVYTKASEELVASRNIIAQYSFTKAHDRILRTKNLREHEDLQLADDKAAYDLYVKNSELALNSSQIGDSRPLTCTRFRSDGRYLASGSLGCNVKIWDAASFSCAAILRGHTERITSLAWPESASSDLLASCSSDGNCNIWKLNLFGEDSSMNVNVDDDNDRVETRKVISSRGVVSGDAARNEPGQESDNDSDHDSDMAIEEEEERISKRLRIPDSDSTSPTLASKPPPPLDRSSNDDSTSIRPTLQLNGSGGVVGDCGFHPMGGLVGTAHHDFTWRLWDIETGTELLFQDGGHCRECCSIAFHPDGSLVMTGDSGGVLQLWDLRSGQNIHGFQGHMKKITGIDFSMNGFQVASSGIDNSARIWDLRKRKTSYILPAHSLPISDVRYSKSGELLLTTSFDGTLKVWGSRDYRLVRTLLGHTGKVMGGDFSHDERRLVSAGFDRTLKYWTHRHEL